MTELLYLEDSYVKEFNATITKVNEIFVVLDKTYFYPQGGGQLNDNGKIIKDNEEYNIIFGKKVDDDVSYEVDKTGLKVNDKVRCVLDWDRRYALMRYHTACHLLACLINKRTNALITGNQLDIDKGRIDFDLENFDKELMINCIKEGNEIIEKDLIVKISFMKREEALKLPELFKLKNVLPKEIDELRIVEIDGIDRQADGGTHVKSLKEIGRLEFLKAENKGKDNRRVYFRII